MKGDITKKAEFAGAIEKAKIDSPRGTFTMSKSHNPVQDIYLRKVDGKENKLVNIAVKGLADPAAAARCSSTPGRLRVRCTGARRGPASRFRGVSRTTQLRRQWISAPFSFSA